MAASTPNASSSQQRASNSAEQSLGDIATALKEANKPETPDTGCERGRDDRRSDLCAQWKAADAADASAVWTRRSYYLGIIGLVVGFMTLIAAAVAAWFASKSVTETKRIGEAQTRCYVATKGVTFSYDVKNGPIVKADFFNSGQSPAIKCRWFVRMGYLPNQGIMRELEEVPGSLVGGHFNISAQSNHAPFQCQPQQFLTEEEFELGRNGVMIGFFVRVRITGEDVFGRQFDHCDMFTGYLDGTMERDKSPLFHLGLAKEVRIGESRDRQQA